MADDDPVGFTVSEPPKAGLFGRMLGRVPKEAAFVEIRNILATTPFDQVRPNDVASVLAKSKLTPRDVVAELQSVFEHAVLILAADRELGSSDRRTLSVLQRVFELTDEEAGAAIERAIGSVFQKAMREALADGKFTPAERQALEATSAALGMTEARTKQLYGTAAVAAVQATFSAVMKDRRYSSIDERQVEELAGSLGVQIEHDAKTAALVERFRLLARIDEGELPIVTAPILLQRGEVCHFTASGLAHKELRTLTKRVNYSGPTASIRIMKGVRWRIGSVSVERVTQDVLTQVDTVDFYITSKKIFLRGGRKNTSLVLGKLAHFTVFEDGIQLEKQTGRDIYLVGDADWEMAGACLEAVARP